MHIPYEQKVMARLTYHLISSTEKIGDLFITHVVDLASDLHLGVGWDVERGRAVRVRAVRTSTVATVVVAKAYDQSR